MPARLLLCLLLGVSWLTVEGDLHVGAAGVLHRRGGLAAVAVSVGAARGVPARNSRSLVARLSSSRVDAVVSRRRRDGSSSSIPAVWPGSTIPLLRPGPPLSQRTGTCGIGGDLLVGAATRLWRPPRGIDSSLTSSGKPPMLLCHQISRDHAEPPPKRRKSRSRNCLGTLKTRHERSRRSAGGGSRSVRPITIWILKRPAPSVGPPRCRYAATFTDDREQTACSSLLATSSDP